MQLKFQSAVGRLLMTFIVIFNIVMILLFTAKIFIDSYITVKLGLFFLAVDILFIAPLIMLTYYKFEDDYLLIHDFPIRKYKIKYTDIFNVEDGDFETKDKTNVGLSFDRVAIGYRKYLSEEADDYVERYVFISPREMNLFLIRMSARLKQNEIDIEEKAKQISLKQQEHELKKKLAEEKRAKKEKENEPEIIKVRASKTGKTFKAEEVGENAVPAEEKADEAPADTAEEDGGAE